MKVLTARNKIVKHGAVPMKKLAIVSSYNESCGNASYTHVLKNALSSSYETEVIPLDLFFIQKSGKLFKKHADEHIREIAEKLKSFDCVNIQFEAGLYGTNPADILRRVGWLIEASRNIIVTMHRVDPPSVTIADAIGQWIETRSNAHFHALMNRRKYERLYQNVVNKVAEASKEKNAWVFVHTKRDRRIIKEMYGFDNCIDHPLAFLTPEERAQVKDMGNKEAFLAKHGFNPGTKLVGIFGYISAYKGVETAVAAMEFLPPNYALAMFGSQHPQTIREYTEIDPFLAKITDSVRSIEERRLAGEQKALDKLIKLKVAKGQGPTTLDDAREDLIRRMRFMGNLSDPDFIEALHLCDAVVLPYLEVGQSMSGVLVLALESGARMFASNNLSFFEARKYFGEVYNTFDIGNAMELAQKIQFTDRDFSKERDAAYERFNIRTLAGLMEKTYNA